jgi:hypothetical protein
MFQNNLTVLLSYICSLQAVGVSAMSSTSSTFNLRYYKMAKLTEDTAATPASVTVCNIQIKRKKLSLCPGTLCAILPVVLYRYKEYSFNLNH